MVIDLPLKMEARGCVLMMVLIMLRMSEPMVHFPSSHTPSSPTTHIRY